MNMIHISETRVSRKREHKREAILQAALELLGSEGIEGLTMQKLAQRTDYAVGALYRYVASKEVLLAQLQILALESYDSLYLQATESLAQRFPERCVLTQPALCAGLFAQSRTEAPALFALVSEATGHSRNLLEPGESQGVLKAAWPLLLRFSGWFAQARQQGLLTRGEPRQQAILYWTSVQGLVQAAKLARHAPALFAPELLAELNSTLFAGWGASSETCQQVAQEISQFCQQPGLQALLAHWQADRQSRPLG